MRETEQISYLQEIRRKGIHLLSLLIPIIYTFIEQDIALYLLLPMTFISGAGDILRYFNPTVRDIVTRFFGKMMRPHELDGSRLIFNGATYVLLSASLCVLLFPKIIAITAFTILIISDISSALIGRKYGTIPFFDKSLQGSMAFFVSAVLVIIALWLLTGVPAAFLIIGAIAAAIGAVVEAASITLKMDDNFSIPMSIGFSTWGMLFFLNEETHRAILSAL